MKRLASMAALALAWSAHARAEEALVAPVVVVSGAHYDTTVGGSDAASAGAITSALIANRPVLRTGEILEFVPGMIVTQHSGSGKANQYFLRGYNLDHGTDFASHVDGVPVNMRSHAHGQGYSDLNFVIPELLRRVDYRKGPYFADEGDFASSGAAHLRLADRLEHGIASLSVGQDGYRRALLAGSRTAAGGSLLSALEVQRDDGPWEHPERVRKLNAVLRHAVGPEQDGYRLTATAYRNRWNAADQIPQRAVAAGAVGRFGALDASDGGVSERASLSLQRRMPLGGGQLEAQAWALRSRLDLYSNFTYQLDDPQLGDQFEQSERRRAAGASLSWAWGSELAALTGVTLRNRIGLQTRHDYLDPVGLYATRARVRHATVHADRVRQRSTALYADSSIQWNAWLRSVTGLRVEASRFAVAGPLDGDDGRASDSIVLPKLALIGALSDRTEVFFNAGRGFHSNDARAAVDGAGLAPTRGLEIGLRSEALPGLQTSLALWRLHSDSELVFVGDAGTTEPAGASRRRGIELSHHYVAAPGLLFDLDLAWSRARYRDGAHVPGAPERVAAFGLTLEGRGPWSAGLDLRHIGPRPLREDNAVRAAATTLAYARLAYAFSPRTRLSVDVFNLFDRRANDIEYWYASRLAGEPADGVEDRHFHPVVPRTARLTLTHHF